MKQTINPLKHDEILTGSVPVPASKSHTIRALLIATLGAGESFLEAPLDSEDARSCLKACRSFGAVIDTDSQPGLWKVQGTRGILTQPEQTIDVGNSGTTLYLAASLAALLDQPVRFDGDDQILRRSASNLLTALKGLGAVIREEGLPGCTPFTITGPAYPGSLSMECPTSQYLSGLLLAAPLFSSPETAETAGSQQVPKVTRTTEISVPLLFEQPYVEMTLRWMREQGITCAAAGDLSTFSVPAGQTYTSFKKRIPTDFSSATFFFCAAAITESTLFLEGLDMTDTQGDREVVRMLEKMGCSWESRDGGILFSGAPLKGCTLDLNATPDALPALAVTACYAEGETRLVNVAQARIKETDRIAVMTSELKKLGAEIEEREDGLIIQGSPLTGGSVKGHGDHRIVMSMAIAALGASGPITVDTAEAVDITFPGFFEILESIRC